MTKGKGRTPGAGGLDKHIKRTAHKERSQPAARKHLGALEKHKDYQRRSSRRHAKQAKLQQIKRAAAQRNPDEFHIGMTKAIMDVATGKMKRRPKQREENRDAMEKSIRENAASVRYLEFKAQEDFRRTRELLEDGVGLDAAPVNKHTIFVDDDVEVKKFNAAKYFDTAPDMIKFPATRGKLSHMGDTVSAEGLLESSHALLSQAQRAVLTKKKLMKSPGTPGADDDSESAHCNEDVRVEEGLVLTEKERRLAARKSALQKVKEVSQRFSRGKELTRIANKIRSQSRGIKQSLEMKKSSRFRKGVAVRSR
jgi:hypothetical protein